MPNPYVKDGIHCAVCGAVRQETNHWFVQFIARGDTCGLPLWITVMVTCTYDRELLNNPIAVPTCGEACAGKYLQSFMESVR